MQLSTRRSSTSFAPRAERSSAEFRRNWRAALGRAMYNSCMTSRVSTSAPAEPREWTFLTNHAHVLLCIAEDPEVRLRDVATSVGITERAAQRIVMELEEAGYLERERVGRRNRYRLHADQPLRHPMDRDHWVSELLTVLAETPPARRRPPVAKKAAAGKTKKSVSRTRR